MESKLLIASHIVPGASQKQAKLDPFDGLLLSPHYDRRFDQGPKLVQRRWLDSAVQNGQEAATRVWPVESYDATQAQSEELAFPCCS